MRVRNSVASSQAEVLRSASATGAEALVAMLEAYQVEYVFGVPGDTSIPFYEALRTAASVTHVLARDERGAAYMADVYARLSGRPGVCEAPSGAGALYLAPGVAEANASSIPVIALCSDTPIATDGRNVLTELDQPALFAPITKWTTRATSADRIPELVRAAFRTATTGRPGAVHIAFPEDVLAAPLDGAPALHADPECASYPAHRQAPEPAAVRTAAGLLRVAQRPAIVAGGGVRVAGAWNELTSVAEALGAPVGTSINGHGAIDDRHRLSIGVVGGNGARPEANDVLARADLVLFVGCKTDSVTTRSWQQPARDGSVTIVHLDVDPREIGNTYPTAAGVVGDARLGLAALDAAIRTGSRVPRACWADPVAIRASWDAAQLGAVTSGAVPIRPQRVLRTLLDLLPDDPVIVADAGTPTPFTSALFAGPGGRHVVIPRGFGGLGYALPGVVGAALARPRATVVGLMGDGSFAMAAGDLETIARLGLAVTLVHFNNGAFGWIKALQYHHPQAECFGVDFSTGTDYAAIARGFGLTAYRVTDPSDLQAALKRALDDDGPSFVDVATAAEDVETPPVHAWVDKAVGR